MKNFSHQCVDSSAREVYRFGDVDMSAVAEVSALEELAIKHETQISDAGVLTLGAKLRN